MTDQSPIKFSLNGIGEVTMKGTGPWTLRQYNHTSADILDSTGQVASPSVRAKARTASSVVFARVQDAQAVVAKANEILLAEQAQF
jgi:hypothetical protein